MRTEQPFVSGLRKGKKPLHVRHAKVNASSGVENQTGWKKSAEKSPRVKGKRELGQLLRSDRGGATKRKGNSGSTAAELDTKSPLRNYQDRHGGVEQNDEIRFRAAQLGHYEKKTHKETRNAPKALYAQLQAPLQ